MQMNVTFTFRTWGAPPLCDCIAIITAIIVIAGVIMSLIISTCL